MKHMTDDQLFKSFEGAKKYIDSQFKRGIITGETARKLIEDARRSYQNKNYNRQLDEMV